MSAGNGYESIFTGVKERKCHSTRRTKPISYFNRRRGEPPVCITMQLPVEHQVLHHVKQMELRAWRLHAEINYFFAVLIAMSS